jgi:serine/threonine-protein kinase 19
VQVVPFVLQSHLYTVIKDKTSIDKDLNVLRQSNQVRFFKLPYQLQGFNDYAIMLTRDYCQLICTCKAGVKNQSVVFDRFCQRVLPNYSDVVISKDKLATLLMAGDRSVPMSSCATSHRNEVDRSIDALLRSCCLTIYTQGNTAAYGEETFYLFSMPNAGKAIRGIGAGRKELLSIFRRRKPPELLEAHLLFKEKGGKNKFALKTSPLGMSWHIIDLLAHGLLVRIQTSMGPVLREVKHASENRTGVSKDKKNANSV